MRLPPSPWGCLPPVAEGGSGGSATGQTEPTHHQPLGRAELIAKADAICVSGQKAFLRVSREAYLREPYEAYLDAEREVEQLEEDALLQA